MNYDIDDVPWICIGIVFLVGGLMCFDSNVMAPRLGVALMVLAVFIPERARWDRVLMRRA